MTPEEITAMAKEAGFANVFWTPAMVAPFERFAVLVAEKAAALEREACAQVCYAIAARAMAVQGGALDSTANVMLRQVAVLGSGSCARAIRARGQKGGL